MKKIFLFFVVCCNWLMGGYVDIVSSFPLEKHVLRGDMAKQTGLKVRYFTMDFHKYYELVYQKRGKEVDKVILMEAVISSPGELRSIPSDKLISFLFEPYDKRGNPHVSKIFTYNDDLIDNVRIFKLYYPVLTKQVSQISSFEEKKFCVMVSRAPSFERKKIVRFFETKPAEDFDLYGYQSLIPSSHYRGAIPGHEFGNEKAELMKRYRFAICFENCQINGYVTEKIFSCFSAGCVPVYFGAPNVTKYIPKECFINYCDFKTDEDLYQFLKKMTKEEYQGYMTAIKKFLESPEAKLFSAENFCQTVAKAVKH